MVLRLRASPFRISRRPYSTSQASANKIGQDNRWPGWQVVIGIETHAQIKSREKLFSRGSDWMVVCAARTNAHIASLSLSLRDMDPRPREQTEYTCVSIRCCISRNTACEWSTLSFIRQRVHHGVCSADQFYVHQARHQNCHRIGIRYSTALDV